MNEKTGGPTAPNRGGRPRKDGTPVKHGVTDFYAPEYPPDRQCVYAKGVRLLQEKLRSDMPTEQFAAFVDEVEKLA